MRDSRNPNYSLSSGQEDFLKEFANDPSNLRYRYTVLFDTPEGWDHKPVELYTGAQAEMEDKLPAEATNPQIICLLNFWEG